MPRITDYSTLPIFGAATAQGPAIVATFPYARPSLSQHVAVQAFNRFVARWKAARTVRRNAYALGVLSDNELRDIGLNRANIVSAATEAGVSPFRTDTDA
jgi:uncharacterized protein YjiS (DUF1127 family)